MEIWLNSNANTINALTQKSEESELKGVNFVFRKKTNRDFLRLPSGYKSAVLKRGLWESFRGIWGENLFLAALDLDEPKKDLECLFSKDELKIKPLR
jgi:hypothetical protein